MACQPLISGIMLSLGPNSFADSSYLYRMGAGEWRAELDAMQRFGIDWLGCWSGLETCVERRAAVPGGDLIGFLLREAEERNMRLSLSCGFCPGWWEEWNLPKALAFTGRSIERLRRRYGAFRSFDSWYLDYEIYLRWGEEAEQMAELYRGVTAYCHEADRRPVMVSPFFQPDTSGRCGVFRYGEPAEYYPFWRDLLAGSGIDILALQDNGGQHLGCFGDGERLPFIREVTRACRDAGVRYWGNVESGELPVASVDAFAERYGAGGDVNDRRIRPDWRAVPLPKLERKLELAARDAEKIMSWGYMEFFRPGGGAENRRNYQAYCSYRDRLCGAEAESASPELSAAGNA